MLPILCNPAVMTVDRFLFEQEPYGVQPAGSPLVPVQPVNGGGLRLTPADQPAALGGDGSLQYVALGIDDGTTATEGVRVTPGRLIAALAVSGGGVAAAMLAQRMMLGQGGAAGASEQRMLGANIVATIAAVAVIVGFGGAAKAAGV